MRRLSGQLLFDEYAIPDTISTWRRPEEYDISESLHESRNSPLFRESLVFANELKILSLFSSETYVDPYWLLNNPKTMILSNLPRRNPNWLTPFFEQDFIVTYWGRKHSYKYDDLFGSLYPVNGEPSLNPNSSYINEIYNNQRSFFEEYLRVPLTNYVATCLSRIDLSRDSDPELDPQYAMQTYLLDLFSNTARHIPNEEIDKALVEHVIKETIDSFLKQDSVFSMTSVRSKWREFARNGYEYLLTGKNAQIVDWIFRNSVYLRAHSDIVKGIPFGYSETSTYIGELKQLSRGNLKRTKGGMKIEFLNMDWNVYSDYFGYLSNHLSNLSFRTIFNTIRKESFFAEYKKKLNMALMAERPDDYFRQLIEAYNYLLGCIVPIFNEERIDPIFKQKSPWGILGWYIDNNQNLSAIIGPISATATAVATFSLPFTILAGLASAGLVAFPSQVNSFDSWLKRIRGRRMFMALGRLS